MILLSETLNSKGFTLIETLIVFSVFCLLSFASVLLIGPSKDNLTREMFLSQLQSDLLFAQQYAISHQEKVNVVFTGTNNSYYIRTDPFNPKLLERQYADDIQIREDTMGLRFNYMVDGNINKFGSWHLQVGDEFYRLTFQIGKGRFYIVRE